MPQFHPGPKSSSRKKNPTACASGIIFRSCLILASPSAFCQQDYVGRYDAYAGYGQLASPRINLLERGFHLQAGVTPRSWYALGFDYSMVSGRSPLTPNLLTVNLQQQLGGVLAQLTSAGAIPTSYILSLPVHSKTQTFAAGPQFAYRHWRYVTPFIRPAIGAIHETSTPRAADPIAKSIAAQLVPTGEKQDLAGFYGFGGGFDLNISKHISLRLQADLVRTHLFQDLLKDSRNMVRFGAGPAFHFGKNIAQ